LLNGCLCLQTADLMHRSGADVLAPGVHVVATDSALGVMRQVLSAYCRAAQRPERHTLLLCSSATAADELESLGHRWRGGRRGTLFCVANLQVMRASLLNGCLRLLNGCLHQLNGCLCLLIG